MSLALTRTRDSVTFRANRIGTSVLVSTAVPPRLSRIWSAVSPIILPMAEWAAGQLSHQFSCETAKASCSRVLAEGFPLPLAPLRCR